jgi:hypothetical protein
MSEERDNFQTPPESSPRWVGIAVIGLAIISTAWARMERDQPRTEGATGLDESAPVCKTWRK